METLATTLAPAGSLALGVRTRTVSFSAQYVLPVTALPLAVTEKAGVVVVSSILVVKRTEMSCPGSTSVEPSRGRKRRTEGTAWVATVSGTTKARGAPAASFMVAALKLTT